MAAGAGMLATTVALDVIHRRRVESMNDAVIEQAFLTDDFRR
jgi:hypothetical protein